MLNHPTVPTGFDAADGAASTSGDAARPVAATAPGQVVDAQVKTETGNHGVPAGAAPATAGPGGAGMTPYPHAIPVADMDEHRAAQVALRQEIAAYIEREEAALLAQEAAEARAVEAAERKARELAELQAREEDERELREARLITAREEAEKREQEREREEKRVLREADRTERRLANAQVPFFQRWAGRLAGMLVATLVLVAAGGAGFLLGYSVDKPELERSMSTRFGVAVKVGEAKFTPYPLALHLHNVKIGDFDLPSVVATTDIAALLSAVKVWRTVDIAGFEFDTAQLGALAALATYEPPCTDIPSWKVRRIRARAVGISGAPVVVPKVDADVTMGADCRIKQAVLTLADGVAQVTLAPDPGGWLVDAEASGFTWLGVPKVPLEGMRATGVATSTGMKFESLTINLAGGVVRGSGSLDWKPGWIYHGVHEAGGLDVESLAEALYGASPLSGVMEGKFNFSMQANSLPELFDAPQITGDFTLQRVQFKSINFARLLEGISPVEGKSRFNEFKGTLQASNGALQMTRLYGESGTLKVSGTLDVRADRNLHGVLNVESPARAGSAVKMFRVGGSVAQPLLGR
jgi:hypothetical protein